VTELLENMFDPDFESSTGELEVKRVGGWGEEKGMRRSERKRR
jgi:hypothetical protein